MFRISLILLLLFLAGPARAVEPIVETGIWAIEEFDLSPDGRHVLWLAFHDGEKRVYYRDLEGGPNKVLPLIPGAELPHWAGDNRHIVLLSDPTGDERHHVMSFDTADPVGRVRDISPFAGKKAFLLNTNAADGSVLVAMTIESDEQFTLYRLSADGGKATVEATPLPQVAVWMTSLDGRYFGRVRPGPGDSILVETRGQHGNWGKLTLAGDFFLPGDGVAWHGDTLPDGSAWMAVRHQQDMVTPQRIRLDSGAVEESLPAGGSDASLFLFEADWRPLIVQSMPDYPLIRVYDPALRSLMGKLPLPIHAAIKSVSFNLAMDRLLMMFISDGGEQNLIFIDRKRNIVQPMFRQAPAVPLEILPKTQPISLTARDGLGLKGYLSYPANAQPQHLPLVLLVHGGPWMRDEWGFNFQVHALTLQGYAVLRVNFRGSGGLGRAFERAGRDEWGGRMQDDLTDSVCWAIDSGIADPTRIAIMGGSYGGYAAIEALERTPRLYVGAIEQDGPMDLPAMIDELPPYSRPYRKVIEDFIGTDRRQQWERSPLAHVERIEKPVLAFQGQNDPRVKASQLKKLEQAMRKAGKTIAATYFADEGHGINHERDYPTLLAAQSAFLKEAFQKPNDPETYRTYCDGAEQPVPAAH